MYNIYKYVILSKAKYLKLFLLRLTPHLNPQPYGTQFHSTQLRFVGSASVPRRGMKFRIIPSPVILSGAKLLFYYTLGRGLGRGVNQSTLSF